MTNNKEKEENNIKRISFSELKNWKECPYRHKLIYVDKLKHFQGNEYTAFGTAIHSVCEEIIHENNIKDPIDIFNSAFLKELDNLKKIGIPLRAEMINDMRRQAEPICKQVLPAVHEHFGNFKVISVEEKILEPITEFESFGTNFKGFIDLVIRTSDKKYHIIDWKTCSWGWSRDKKNDAITTYQLTYYKNYFSKKHNIPPKDIETCFVLLKRTAKKENVEVLKITSGPKKTENSLKVLQNAIINIDNKNYIKNRLNCKYCDFYKTENCK